MSEKKGNKAEEGSKERSGHLSRREFLKDAGLVISGSTMGSIAFAAEREPQQEAKAGEVGEAPRTQESTDMRSV